MEKSKEQQLVDLCFLLVLTATCKSNKKYFKKATQGEKADWVSKQLSMMGFETKPVGCSHGVLINDEGWY